VSLVSSTWSEKKCRQELFNDRVNRSIYKSSFVQCQWKCEYKQERRQKLEAAQMGFLRLLLGLIGQDCVRIPDIHDRLQLNNLIEDIRPGPRLLVYFRNRLTFYDEELLATRPTPKLDDHPLSAVRYCLFNIFAASLYNWRASPPSAT
jgi:hypothetical protein